MSTLTIMRGPSGSGKSTWSSGVPNAVIVSRDALRLALFGDESQAYYQRPDLRQCEELVTVAEHAAIKAGLSAGKHVISDNTYIEPKFMKGVIKIAHSVGAKVEVKVFDVPLRTLLARNAMRAAHGGRDVPEEVIRKQHDRFQHTKNYEIEVPRTPEPYNGTPGKPEAIMVDIDGTLAHMNDKRGPFDWKNVGVYDVDHVVSDVVRMAYVMDYTVIVMSGRDAVCRPETEAWLRKHTIPFDHLFMRPEKDMRADNLVKADLFDEHVRDDFDVKFVIDDRWQVCEMWLTMGLKVFNVSGLDRGEF